MKIKEKTNEFRWNRIFHKTTNWRYKKKESYISQHLEQKCIMEDGSSEWIEIDFVNTECDF